MFQEIPSRPVLALVIPAVSCCIGQALPCSGGCKPFNHVWRGLETIPNGTGGSFWQQRKRRPGGAQRKLGPRLFAPCLPLCAALSLNPPVFGTNPVRSGGFGGGQPTPRPAPERSGTGFCGAD